MRRLLTGAEKNFMQPETNCQADQQCFSIGRLTVPGRVIAAPMAGITDSPFRILARRHGAALVWSEMLSAKALSFKSSKTRSMMKITHEEHPVGMQIFGNDARTMGLAARLAADQGADIVDINAGCPVPKVKKTGAGCALMKDEKTCASIFRHIVRSVDIPVTLKIRTGMVPGDSRPLTISAIAQEEGIAAVTVHARPATQMHAGDADWAMVRRISYNTAIPVIANGGISNPVQAREVLEYTGCAAVMVGQAALGDYGIFKRIDQYLRFGTHIPEPSVSERMRMFAEHVSMVCDYYGEDLGIKRFRKILPYYIADMPHAASLRSMLLTCNSRKTIFSTLSIPVV
ncbi:MAG: tRNA dihydrouridine synthase DusB [Elusimicrobia bacterium]|nr:tRNA dihydrouridine synthase DusB [Elusimicrobiota bacterium]MBD3411895.1 tRNA dihydrouridine synthase DusB [Elusimicrobiota bacterium]